MRARPWEPPRSHCCGASKIRGCGGAGETGATIPAYAERHGLVVILALGESIISIGLGAAHSALTPNVVIASLVAVSIALGLWWVYFGHVSETAELHIEALTGNRRTTIATIGTYLHFGIVAGILLASLGMGGAIEHIGSRHAPGAINWIALGAGPMMFLASTAAYSSTVRRARVLPQAGA